MTASRPKPQANGNVSLRNILGSTTGPVVSARQPNTAMVMVKWKIKERLVKVLYLDERKGKQTLFTMGSFRDHVEFFILEQLDLMTGGIICCLGHHLDLTYDTKQSL